MSRFTSIASALETSTWTTLEECHRNMSGRPPTKEKLREHLDKMVCQKHSIISSMVAESVSRMVPSLS